MKVVTVIVSIAVIVAVAIAAYGVVNLVRMGRETQQTIEKTAEEAEKTMERVQKRLEPPKILNVNVETKATWVVISWTATTSALCELKVERLGMERFSGVSRGMTHNEIVLGLLPGKEYSFTIEAKSETGSDSYSGTFETEGIGKRGDDK